MTQTSTTRAADAIAFHLALALFSAVFCAFNLWLALYWSLAGEGDWRGALALTGAAIGALSVIGGSRSAAREVVALTHQVRS